ncbi:MAG: DUF4340 domain-containing protein [Coprococcus sp.]
MQISFLIMDWKIRFIPWSFSDSKGNAHQISIGNVTGDTYYATVDDGQTVYTVSAAVMEDLQYSLEEMAQLDQAPPIGSGNLVEETITKAGSQTHLFCGQQR